YFDRSLQLYKGTGTKLDGVTMSYNGLGDAYFEMVDYDRSLYYHQMALHLQDSMNDVWGTSNSLRSIGRIYIKQGKAQLAIDHLTRSIQVAEKRKFRHEINEAYLELATAFEANEEYQRAFYYQQLYIQLHDSLVNIENLKQVNEPETRYQTDKKENQIKLNEKEISLLQEKEKQKMITIWGLLIVLLFSLVIGFLINKSQRLRVQQTEMNLKHQQKELSNVALKIVEKNTFIEN
ncbi:MAG: tetratricopeptide repeat protein, partial [Bacteroidetes bacterium]|nr:tetratricopeptide repeat protein [Bacteroidota bacterium]